MNFLVLGSGGREHAIVKALYHSAEVTEIHVAPGNAAMASQALCHNFDWRDEDQILKLCNSRKIEVVIIGPEDPLVAGLSDRLRDRGILVFGPSQAAARLEGSKIFAKNFMLEHGIPTARAKVVVDVTGTLEAARHFSAPYVLKADGLAAGKGVIICQELEHLRRSAEDFFEKKILGTAGTQALLEEFSPGWELSLLVLTNGTDYQLLPIAQDHKRLLNDDVGPNTGGMGTIAPVSINEAVLTKLKQQVIEPTLHGLRKSGALYRGVIFFGIMMTPNGPSVLEYNCRFGDPETQVILPLLDGSWAQVFHAISQGTMPTLKWSNRTAACVVLASREYPSAMMEKTLIAGLPDEFSVDDNSYFLGAGIARNTDGQWITNGGRVLNAIGISTNLQHAIENAYGLTKKISHEARLQWRTDIGRKS